MSILYRDPKEPTKFIPLALPVIKGEVGPQGEPGVQGVQGDRGDRGVYVGLDISSFDPSQRPDLWIQPLFDEEDTCSLDDVYYKDEVDVKFLEMQADVNQKMHVHPNQDILNEFELIHNELYFAGEKVGNGDISLETEYESLLTDDKTLLGAINEVESNALTFEPLSDVGIDGLYPEFMSRLATTEEHVSHLQTAVEDIQAFIAEGGITKPDPDDETDDETPADKPDEDISVRAIMVTTADAGDYFGSATVEGVLQEIGSSLTRINATAEDAKSATQLLSSALIETDANIALNTTNIQSLTTALVDLTGRVGEAETAIGVAVGTAQSALQGIDALKDTMVDRVAYDGHRLEVETLFTEKDEAINDVQVNLDNLSQQYLLTLSGLEDANRVLVNNNRLLLATQAFQDTRMQALETGGSIVRVTGISVVQDVIYLEVDQTQQIQPTVAPENATSKTVAYLVETGGAAPTISVSETGLVTARNVGNSMVNLVTADGQHRTSVTVYVTRGSGGEGL